MTEALTAKRVNEIYLDCLHKEGELSDEDFELLRAGGEKEGVTITEGIMAPSALHAGRLAGHRDEILRMLGDLPENFRLDTGLGGGGGWSFLEAAVTRKGTHWAEHPTIDQLVQLGLGVGAVKYLLGREMWSAFPGGMPYFAVTEYAVA